MKISKTTTIHQTIKKLLSSADDASRLAAKSTKMEAQAWKAIGGILNCRGDEIDCRFVNPEVVREVVSEICGAYHVVNATESILTYLYLQCRAHFLRYESDFFAYSGEHCLCIDSVEDFDYAVTAYGYGGRSGPRGDIVDFESLDPTYIPFPDMYPVDLVWHQLRSDHALGLGLFKYGKLAKVLGKISGEMMHTAGATASLPVVYEDIAYWGQTIEGDPRNLVNYIALITHAHLLQGMHQ